MRVELFSPLPEIST